MKPVLPVLLCAVLSCGTMPAFSAETTMASAPTAKTVAYSKQNQITDRQIIADIMVIDRNEMHAAALVLKRNVDPAVKNYAMFLKTHHTKNFHQIQKLSKSLQLKPLGSQLSKSMAKQGKKDAMGFKKLSDQNLDNTYIQAMIKGHTDVLHLVDNDFLKKVTNPELKQFLVAFRGAVNVHLEKAKAVESKLSH